MKVVTRRRFRIVLKENHYQTETSKITCTTAHNKKSTIVAYIKIEYMGSEVFMMARKIPIIPNENDRVNGIQLWKSFA
jgi:hypothetical protein